MNWIQNKGGNDAMMIGLFHRTLSQIDLVNQELASHLQ